jgi:IrrE N-terminal-like domain
MAHNLPLEFVVAERKASDLLNRFGICAPEHIRIRDIAYALNAQVIEGPLQKAAASLTVVGDSAVIRVSDRDNPERKRFSVAHELGHLVLKHARSVLRYCKQEDMMEWYTPGQETQANFFAGELTLPSFLLARKCDVKKVNLNPVRQIAQEFRTSLTASAIKFIRLCPEECAVVYSRQGRIVWSYGSETWFHFLKRGKALNPHSVASDFFLGKSIPDEAIEVEPYAWVDNDGLDGIVEHSFGSANYGFVLSVLWIKPR